MSLKSLFQSNRDLDSTIATGGIFLAFYICLTAIIVFATKQMAVPPILEDAMQMTKELMLMVFSYLFTKAVMNKPDDKGDTKS